MPRAVVHNKPVLAPRCASRDIAIGTNLEEFKAKLMKWMSECVTSRTMNPKTGRPWAREKELINDPDTLKTIEKIFHYSVYGPTSMRLGGLTTVTAHFDFGRLSNGQWWVRRVGFSIRGRIDWKEPPEPPVVFKGFQPFVITNDRVDSFVKDLDAGYLLVKKIKENVYKEAKKEAKLLDNPVSPTDLIPNPLPTSVQTGMDVFSGKGIAETAKNLGENILEDGVKGVFGKMPWYQLGKAAVGSWLQAVINNMAGDVARVRRRAFAMFIAGFLEEITMNYGQSYPQGKFDKKYFEMGAAEARKYDANQRYQIQLALLHWVQQNPSNGWNIRLSENWVFPDQYKRYYSPELLARSLYNQLYKTKYSVD